MIPYSKAAHSYYKDLPDNQHRTGDIWAGFPGFDLFPKHAGGVPAIIITPACDLSQSKTHTITYLPILTVRELLSTDVGYSLVRPAVQGMLKANQHSDFAELLDRGGMPDVTTIDLLDDLALTNAGWRPEGRERFRAGVRALRSLLAGHLDAGKYARAAIPTKEWERFRDGIVKNSFADDLHFLPPEQPLYEFSAIREPSVVLFRYPMTIHRRELERASDASAALDPSAIFPSKPLKVTRLEREFLSDLLTRFARLYVRLGSTDFTYEAIAAFATKIDEAC
jgi:hypothetical protein